METKQSKHHDKKLEIDCREKISLLFNSAVDNETAKEMIGGFPSYILAEIIVDTFNRVKGCFQLNETFVDNREEI